MSMSRKQYRDIAAVIAAEVGETPMSAYDLLTFDSSVAIYNIACGLSSVFEIDNPRFDRERFMEACNIPEANIELQHAEREAWFAERKSLAPHGTGPNVVLYEGDE